MVLKLTLKVKGNKVIYTVDIQYDSDPAHVCMITNALFSVKPCLDQTTLITLLPRSSPN